MKRCPECNNLVDDKLKACNFCGYPFTSEETQAIENENPKKIERDNLTNINNNEENSEEHLKENTKEKELKTFEKTNNQENNQKYNFQSIDDPLGNINEKQEQNKEKSGKGKLLSHLPKDKTFIYKVALFTVLLLLVISLGVIGYSVIRVDPLSKQTMEDIKNLGKVTLDSESTIVELEETYSEMTDKQKNQVRNYVDLKNARKELDKLIEEEEQKQAEIQQAAQEAEAAIANSSPYKEAIAFVQAIKDSLYNPSSLQVYSVKYYDALEEYLVDYSGENKLGGTVRKNIIVSFLYSSASIYEENDYGFSDRLNDFDNKDTIELDLNLILEYIN